MYNKSLRLVMIVFFLYLFNLFQTYTITETYAKLLKDIPDQTINEGETFTPINLSHYLTGNDSNISWTATGNTDLKVTINDGVATIEIPNIEQSLYVDFNDTSSLKKLFYSDDSPEFVNISNSGIGNTGSINVLQPSKDIWATKSGYPSSEKGVYTSSVYFKIKAKSGYGGLGFSTNNRNELDSYGSPQYGLGISFHGTGGYLINNRTTAALAWSPELVLGNWYKMILKMTAKGSDKYDLVFQIWNSDNNGVLETMKTEKKFNNVANSSIRNAPKLYGYFSAIGYRVEKIDNFEIRALTPNSDWNGTETIIFTATDLISSNTENSTLSDSAIFKVLPVNDPPLADAGQDKNYDEKTTVTLDGSLSGDIDNDPISYNWLQIQGSTVTLSDPTVITPVFVAPNVEIGGETLVFQLTVTDSSSLTSVDTVSIKIEYVDETIVRHTITSLADNGGSISPVGQIKVIDGGYIRFDIIPNNGFVLSALIVDGKSLTPSVFHLFNNINQDHKIEAVFLPVPTYIVTADATTGGVIKPSGNITLKKDQYQIFTIQPDKDYVIDKLLVDNIAVGAFASYALIADSNHSITAVFAQKNLRNMKGHVTDIDTGVFIPNCLIELVPDADSYTFTSSDESGSYTFIGIPVSENIIASLSLDNTYKQETFSFNYSLDNLSIEQNFRLEKVYSLGLKGKIHDKTNGIANVWVDVFSPSLNLGESELTDNAGQYTITGLQPANDYLLSIYFEPYMIEVFYHIENPERIGIDQPLSSVYSENLATKFSPTDPPLYNMDIIIEIGKTITGHVMQSDPVTGGFLHVPNIWVCAENTSNLDNYFATTDLAGAYTITNLPDNDDSYIVEILSDNYCYQAYDRADTQDEAKKISAGSSGIDFLLEKGVSISGLVADSLGNPISGVSIYAWSVENSSATDGVYLSDSGGFYTITGLMPNENYILAAFSDDFAEQYFQDKKDENSANPIYTKSRHTENINFVLNKGLSIRGTVKNNDGIAIPDAEVLLESEQFNFIDIEFTDNNGKYEFININSNPTDYVLSASHKDYIPQIFDSKGVSLIASSDDKDITLLKGYTVRGKIADKNNPVADATVVLSHISDGTIYKTVSVSVSNNESYNYTITALKPGVYNVSVSCLYYADSAVSSLDLTQNNDNLNFELIPIERRISGTIIGIDKNDSVIFNVASSNFSRNVEFKDGFVTFDITGLPPQDDLKFSISDDLYSLTVYKDNEPLDSINLSDNDLYDLIFYLDKLDAKSVSGFIKFPEDSEDGETVTVIVYSGSKNTQYSAIVRFEKSETYNLPFTITGIQPADDYVLSVSSDNFVNRYYPDSAYVYEASLIDISDDNPDTDFNFTLSRGRKITGKINADKSLSSDITKNLLIEVWSDKTSCNAVATVKADGDTPNGEYSISGLEITSDYLLSIYDEDLGMFYYNPDGLVRTAEHSTKISVEQGDMIINIQLGPFHSIKGTVYTQSRNAIQGIQIMAFSEMRQSGDIDITDIYGNYTIYGLIPSPDYRVAVQPDTTMSWAAQEKTSVESGSDKVNFYLDKAAQTRTFKGKVLSPNNAPVDDAIVELISAFDSTKFFRTTTNTKGDYELTGISDGVYILSVWPLSSDDFAFYRETSININADITKQIKLDCGLVASGTLLEKESKAPIFDAVIVMYSPQNGFQKETKSSKDGKYSITNVPNGSDYIINVRSENYNFQTRYNVSPLSGIDFSLEKKGRIFGEIRDQETGLPIKDVMVSAYPVYNENNFSLIRTSSTNESGYYEISDIPEKDAFGREINEVDVVAESTDYLEVQKLGREIGSNVDFIMTAGNQNNITGKVKNASGLSVFIDVFSNEKTFIKSVLADNSGDYTILGLQPETSYFLAFLAYRDNDKNALYEQWASEAVYPDCASGVDEQNAKSLLSGSQMCFNFNTSLARNYLGYFGDSNDLGDSDPNPKVGHVRFIGSDTPYIEMSYGKTRTIVAKMTNGFISNNSQVSISWNPTTSNADESYYYDFNKIADYEITKRNAPNISIRSRNVTSSSLNGDDVMYYFHIAAVDTRGRIGETISLGFRIDTVAPYNIEANAPENATGPVVELSLNAIGAVETYISNNSYNIGGNWENFTRQKNWSLSSGTGQKRIYIRFRDKANNETNATAKTNYVPSDPYFIVKMKTLENGSVKWESNDQTGTVNQSEQDILVKKGSNLLVTIVPNQHYTTDLITVDKTPIPRENKTYLFENVTQSHQMDIAFKAIKYNIDVTFGKNGKIEPSGVLTVTDGDTRIFNIIPDEHFVINEFFVDNDKVQSLSGSGVSSYTLENIQANHTITATFKQIFTISSDSDQNGTVLPKGNISVYEGGSQTFAITPNDGYTVDKLTIDNETVTPTTQVTFDKISANHTLNVSFKPISFSIHVLVGANGKVSPSGEIIVMINQSQEFTITPDSGYEISGVTINGKSVSITDNRIVLNKITSDYTITVNFSSLQHQITVEADSNGSVSPSGKFFVDNGSRLIFTISPNQGYEVDTVLIDKIPISTNGNTLIVENIVENHVITITFSRVYIITAIADENGQIKPSGQVKVHEAASQTFDISANDLYKIESIQVDGTPITLSESLPNPLTDYVFVMERINQDHQIIATFKLQEYSITVTYEGQGEIVPSGIVSVQIGMNQSFTIVPSDGFGIGKVTIDNIPITVFGNTLSLNKVIASHKVHVVFTEVNYQPIAIDSEVTTDEDMPITFTFLAQDTNDLYFILVKNGTLGQAKFIDNNVGTVRYEPLPNINGTDFVEFRTTDGNLTSNIAKVTININPINDIPVSQSITLTTLEDNNVSGKLTAYDNDSDPLSYTITENAKLGTLVLTNPTTGAIIYTPKPNAYGQDKIGFKAYDGTGYSLESTVTIDITPVNDSPVTYPIYSITAQNTPLDITLSAYDPDPNDPLQFWTSNPSSGTLTGILPYLTFTPEKDFKGTVNFAYSVFDGYTSSYSTITIAVGKPDIETNEDKPVDMTSEIAKIGNIAKLSIKTPPSNGYLTKTDSTIKYSPNPDFFGFDEFTFNIEGQAKDYKINIYVSNVNDPPVIKPLPIIEFDEDTTKEIELIVTDNDSDKITYDIIKPSHGTVSGQAPKLIYSPSQDYNGYESFKVTASDGQAVTETIISLIIKPVNDPPIAINSTVTLSEDTPKNISLTVIDVDSLESKLTYTLTNPQHGTLFGKSPYLTYSPDNDFYGIDKFSFSVADEISESNIATITLTIHSVNDFPVAYNDTFRIDEDSKLNYFLRSSDKENDTLTYKIIQSTTNGDLTLISSVTGAFMYIPKENFFGQDEFTFLVNDVQADSNTAKVIITIEPLNDNPIAYAGTLNVLEDTSTSYTLNATDIDGDKLQFKLVTQANRGKVVIDAFTGNCLYSPNHDETGSDMFMFTVTDANATSNTAIVSVLITPVNDPPVAQDMVIWAVEDETKTGTFLIKDADSNAFTYSIVTSPQKGKIILEGQAANSFVYKPDKDQNGNDSFKYIANDGQFDSNIAQVDMIIAPVNDSPVAQANAYTSDEDQTLQGTLSASDIDRDILTYSIEKTPEKGKVTLTDKLTGEFEYRPFADQTGEDLFTFKASDQSTDSEIVTIRIHINPINDPPVAFSQELEISENMPVSITLTSLDADNDQVTYVITQNPEHGTITNANASVYIFEPTADYFGMERFTFKVSDGKAYSNEATILILVGVLKAEIYTSEDKPVEIGLPENSTITEYPTHGALTKTSDENSIYTYTYFPSENYNGFDKLSYKISESDNQTDVTIYIKPINDAPQLSAKTPNVSINEDTFTDIELIAKDSESDRLTFEIKEYPTKGNVTGTAPNYRYQPYQNAWGNDFVIFQVSDGKSVATTRIEVTIVQINDPPQAKPQTIEVNEDMPVKFSLLASDFENDPIRFTILTQPSHGTLSGASLDVYTPDPDYFGHDEFVFEASDENASTIAKVTIEIAPQNDCPVAISGMLTVQDNKSSTGVLRGSDIDNDTLTFIIKSYPEKGKMILNSKTGDFVYFPYVKASGEDSFIFCVSDGKLESEPSSQLVIIKETPANKIPIAKDTKLYAIENTPTNAQFLAVDENNDALTFSIIKNATKGNAIIVDPQSGKFVYEPKPNITGTDEITFKVNDGKADSNIATVHITIRSANDPEASRFLLTCHIVGPTTYRYMIMNSTGQIVNDTPNYTDSIFSLNLQQGDYRIVIIADNYEPYEYGADTNETIIRLDDHRILTANMIDNKEFSQTESSIEVWHTTFEDGFVINAKPNNLGDKTITMIVEAQSEKVTELSVTGTDSNPFCYTWNKADGKNAKPTTKLENTPNNGDTTYNIVFDFKTTNELNETVTLKSYTVTYTDYATEESQQANKPDYQKAFEKTPEDGGLYGKNAISTTSGTHRFYPLEGCSFNITIVDPTTGTPKTVPINIPPIPPEYFVIEGNETESLKSTDTLFAQITTLTFGKEAQATGVNMKFVVASGNLKGSTAIYNPKETRIENTPSIYLPILLNTDYLNTIGLNIKTQYKTISSNINVMVLEWGQDKFKQEETLIQADQSGLIQVKLSHLTSVGLFITKSTKDSSSILPTGQSSESTGNMCIISVLSFKVWTWILLITLIIFVTAGIFMRYHGRIQ